MLYSNDDVTGMAEPVMPADMTPDPTMAIVTGALIWEDEGPSPPTSGVFGCGRVVLNSGSTSFVGANFGDPINPSLTMTTREDPTFTQFDVEGFTADDPDGLPYTFTPDSYNSPMIGAGYAWVTSSTNPTGTCQ